MECAENFNKRAAPDSLLRKESALAESDRRTCSRYIPQRKRARARLGNRGAMSRTGGRKPGPGPHTGDKHTHMAHTSARAFVSYHFGRSGVHVETRRRDETSDGQSWSEQRSGTRTYSQGGGIVMGRRSPLRAMVKAKFGKSVVAQLHWQSAKNGERCGGLAAWLTQESGISFGRRLRACLPALVASS